MVYITFIASDQVSRIYITYLASDQVSIIYVLT